MPYLTQSRGALVNFRVRRDRHEGFSHLFFVLSLRGGMYLGEWNGAEDA
jgi:hypothetical protein